MLLSRVDDQYGRKHRQAEQLFCRAGKNYGDTFYGIGKDEKFYDVVIKVVMRELFS